MSAPIDVTLNSRHNAAKVEIPLAGDGSNDASQAALRTLRDSVLPSTLGPLEGVRYAVTGETAGTHDFNQTVREHWPVVFAFVLGLAFTLLLLTFRSLAVPLTAIALNLLSVGAAYGALVWLRDRRTLIQQAKGGRGSSRLWALVLRPALRFPALAVSLAVGVLIVMSTPVLGIHTKLPGFSELPKKLQIARSYEKIQRSFPGAQSPAVVVVQASDVRAPSVQRAIASNWQLLYKQVYGVSP